MIAATKPLHQTICYSKCKMNWTLIGTSNWSDVIDAWAGQPNPFVFVAKNGSESQSF